MDMFLIKDGESIKGKGSNGLYLPDHKAGLSLEGEKEIIKTAIFLHNYLDGKNIDIKNAIIWVSPFLRARESAQIIGEKLGISNIKEDYSLIEQRFGLFTNTSVGRNKMIYEDEFKFYDNYFQNDGEFYAKLPQGESPMDVALRTRQFLSMISDEKEKPVFVVSHGVTIKTIVMNTLNYSPEWFSKEPLSENGSIRIINKEHNTDYYIYGGPVKIK